MTVSVTARIVRNVLPKMGLRATVAPKKPCLSKKNIRARLSWANKACKAHIDWALDDWKRVVWSDESKIDGFGSNFSSIVQFKHFKIYAINFKSI